MMVLENIHGAPVARVLVAVLVIAGRVALDRVLPRGHLAATPHRKRDDPHHDV
jgi:hypothetical protein